jgi:hypothetical protein
MDRDRDRDRDKEGIATWTRTEGRDRDMDRDRDSNISLKSCEIAIAEVIPSSCEIAIADSRKSCACPPVVIVPNYGEEVCADPGKRDATLGVGGPGRPARDSES